MADLDDIFDADDDDVNPSIDPVINALSDREISDELRLPDVLTSLSRREKLDLIVFKRSHNEIDWEEELLQRQEFIARKADMERLKRMTATDKKTKGKNKKSTTIEDSDDDLSDFAGMGTMDSDDSDEEDGQQGGGRRLFCLNTDSHRKLKNKSVFYEPFLFKKTKIIRRRSRPPWRRGGGG